MNQFLSEKQSELFSTASNVETRDSRSRGAMIEERNKEVSSVPLVNRQGMGECKENPAGNDLQNE